MKKTLLLFLVLLALGDFTSAQQTLIQRPLQSSASTCQPSADSTACVFLQVSPQTNSADITVTGTYSGTLQFEISGDGGTTWVGVNATPVPSGTAVSSTTSTGTWNVSLAGHSFIRVRCSAYTSGVATVSLNPSQAVIASTGGGGSGTVSNCASSGLPYYNTSGTTVICDPNITVNGSGSLTATGQLTAGTAAGSPGFVDKTIGYLGTSMAVQSSTTCTNVTNMTWSIAALKNYVLSCEMPVLFVASAQIQWCLGGPGSPASATLSVWGDTSAVTAYIQEDTINSALWSATKTATFASPGAVSRVYHIKAEIQNSAANPGTLTLQTAGNGTNNIQVLADTACTLTQTN